MNARSVWFSLLLISGMLGCMPSGGDGVRDSMGGTGVMTPSFPGMINSSGASNGTIQGSAGMNTNNMGGIAAASTGGMVIPTGGQLAMAGVMVEPVPSPQPPAGGGNSAPGPQPSPDPLPNPDMGTDMDCIDAMYAEALPTPEVPIDDLIDGYRPNTGQAFLLQIMERRYPLGAHIIERGNVGAFMDCVGIFLRDESSARAVLRQASTIVHECGHSADLARRRIGTNDYIITLDTTLTCSQGDTTTRNGRTFARSRLNSDEYALPACRGPNCDSYRDVYLTGNPDDQSFDSGDQGFNSVLEETLQYINSLATGFAIHPELIMGGFSVSERDGILTFLWYVMRYLRLARLQYPDAYAFISGDPCWRELILTIWGRAWLYLELTEPVNGLGINDVAILARVMTPELQAEIQAIRDAHGCADGG